MNNVERTTAGVESPVNGDRSCCKTTMLPKRQQPWKAPRRPLAHREGERQQGNTRQENVDPAKSVKAVQKGEPRRIREGVQIGGCLPADAEIERREQEQVAGGQAAGTQPKDGRGNDQHGEDEEAVAGVAAK